LLSARFTDPDADNTLVGVAIVANTATTSEGEWQYATNALTWQPIGTTSSSFALAIDSATWIRFVPAADYNGTSPTIDFRAIDSSYTGTFSDNTSRINISTLSNGGITPISTTVASASVTVNAVNDAPVISAGAALPDIFEDSPDPVGDTVANTFNGFFADIDTSASFKGIAITAAPTNQGDWQYSINGTDWTNITGVNTTSALALDTAAHIRFAPDIHFNGTPSPLTVHAIDDTYTGLFTSSTATQFLNTQTVGGTTAYSDASPVSLNVISVNDRPNAADTTLPDIREDNVNPGGIKIGSLYTGNFSDVDSTHHGIAVHQNLTTTEGQWQYTIDGNLWSNISTVSISNALVLSDDSGLRFLPATNYNGTPPALAVRVIDDTYNAAYTTNISRATADLTSLAADSAISASDSLINISVLAVNDSPQGQNNTVTMDEGEVYRFNVGDFGFTDLVENHAFDRIRPLLKLPHCRWQALRLLVVCQSQLAH